jgi:hypothetical protein
MRDRNVRKVEKIASPYLLMAAWFALMIGLPIFFGTIIVFLLWFYDYLFQLGQIGNGISLYELTTSFLVGAVLVFGARQYWRRSVVTKNQVRERISRMGFDCSSGLDSIRARRSDMDLSIDFKSPFLHYKPGPRWRHISKGGAQVVEKVGGFSPYYMRTYGQICIERRLADPVKAKMLAARMQDKMVRFFSERPVLALALRGLSNQNSQMVLHPSIDGERVSLCLNIGSWVGPAYLDVLDEMINASGADL